MKKTVVFKYKEGWGDHTVKEEEFEYESDATEEEIQKDYEEWVWNMIGDKFTWYYKENK
ncbi:MAG: hypothetical protein N4A54_04140 [Peptostreptococcaceae bacterium]|jgi:hypothetical protein|nr:hypothetical protein [Peptostreptococcaceae bacterium]